MAGLERLERTQPAAGAAAPQPTRAAETPVLRPRPQAEQSPADAKPTAVQPFPLTDADSAKIAEVLAEINKILSSGSNDRVKKALTFKQANKWCFLPLMMTIAIRNMIVWRDQEK